MIIRDLLKLYSSIYTIDVFQMSFKDLFRVILTWMYFFGCTHRRRQKLILIKLISLVQKRNKTKLTQSSVSINSTIQRFLESLGVTIRENMTRRSSVDCLQRALTTIIIPNQYGIRYIWYYVFFVVTKSCNKDRCYSFFFLFVLF